MLIKNCWLKADILPKKNENENEINMDNSNDYTNI